MYRKNAKIFALSSGELKKYEYLTGEDLGYRPDPVQKPKFEYIPLGQVFNKELDSNERQEGLLKRLKKDKTDNQLLANRGQKIRQMSLVNKTNYNTISAIDFDYGGDKKLKELKNRLKNISFENITPNNKIFSVTISGDDYIVDKYRFPSVFASELSNGTISLEKAIKEQKKISKIVSDLDKKIRSKKLTTNEKENVRREVIDAFIRLTKKETHQKLPKWVKVTEKRLDEIDAIIDKAEEDNLKVAVENKTIGIDKADDFLKKRTR